MSIKDKMLEEVRAFDDDKLQWYLDHRSDLSEEMLEACLEVYKERGHSSEDNREHSDQAIDSSNFDVAYFIQEALGKGHSIQDIDSELEERGIPEDARLMQLQSVIKGDEIYKEIKVEEEEGKKGPSIWVILFIVLMLIKWILQLSR